MTKFEIDGETDIMKALKLYKEDYIKLSSVPQWFATNGKKYHKIAISDCTVLAVDPTVTMYGSWTLHVDDDSLEDKGMKPFKCYVPDTIEPSFRADSVISIAYRPSKSKNGEINLNVLGIYAWPKYLVKRQPVKEIEFDEDELVGD